MPEGGKTTHVSEFDVALPKSVGFISHVYLGNRTENVLKVEQMIQKGPVRFFFFFPATAQGFPVVPLVLKVACRSRFLLLYQ